MEAVMSSSSLASFTGSGIREHPGQHGAGLRSAPNVRSLAIKRVKPTRNGSSVRWSVRLSVGASVGVRAEIEYVDGKEAEELVKKEGYTVLDVRDPTQYEKAHIKGSIHVPLFIVNDAMDPKTMVLRQAHNNFTGFLYGKAFTKPNPAFLAQVQSAFPNKAAKLLLVCQEGLRSAAAVLELEKAGYSSLAQLDDGLDKVNPGLFEKEGPRELKEAGKGGFVAIQQQFSIGLASILLTLLAIVTFFPDFALKFLGE